MDVKKSQNLYDKQENESRRNINGVNHSINRHVTSYVREQVIDADYTFSFLEMSHNEDRKENKQSSPLFSYFSPPNVLIKQSNEPKWKTPRIRLENINKEEDKRDVYFKRKLDKPKHLSADIFESQSDLEETDFKRPELKLTPDENLIKRVREKCFGRSDF
ncbi:unnamed protein product [Colias eurytheme]|nr:unnamed protein product [Colias eurytheme]